MPVDFGEEQVYGAGVSPRTNSGLIGLVIKWGLAKDSKGATVVLIATTVLCVGAAIAMLVLSGGGGESIPPEVFEKHITQPQFLPQ